MNKELNFKSNKKIFTVLMSIFILAFIVRPAYALQETKKTYTDSSAPKYSIFDYDNMPSDGVIKTEVTKDEVALEDKSKTAKKLKLISDTVDFYPEINQYIAKGNAELIIPEERFRMTANEIIIDQRAYSLIGIGNVKIVQDDGTMYGDYIKIDTKRETSFLKRPILYYEEIIINAKTANLYANETFAYEGDAVLNKSNSMILSTSTFGGMRPELFFDPKLATEGNSRYKIITKEMIIKRQQDRTDITLKDASLYKGKYKIGYAPNILLSTDKDTNYIETNFIEMGSRPRIGTFIAPAVVTPLPNAGTLKIAPLASLSTDNKFGVGGFARLSTPKSKTNMMYSTATGNLLISGDYKFNDSFRLTYAVNDYIPTGWMGGQMPNMGAEFVYDKNINVPEANFMAFNRASVGLFQDVMDHGSPLSTIRYKWMIDGFNRAPLWNWQRYLMLGYRYQHDISIYQTGVVAGTARIGPRIYSNLGPLFLEATYFSGATLNESPFWFDKYRYGRNNVMLRGQVYLNKYISLGYIGSINIGDKSFEGDWLTENQILAAIGTEDIKIRMGFDTVRNTSAFGVDMLLGAKKSVIEFDRMKVIDFDVTSEPAKKKDNKKVKL
ncbi:MAG: hypothetical protein PHX18_06185 [Candidatus Gastranaerophilales bacterium]|nr:hypothetical protein [Candidatus Gastranaerophilales bacterium]